MMYQRMLCVWILMGMVSVADASSAFEVCNHGKETLSSMICNGPTVLKETVINGDMKVVGALTANNIKVGAMVVSGAVDIKNSKVDGAVEVEGPFHADAVAFRKDLRLQSEDIWLNHSTVAGSVFIHAEKNKPILHMQCGSIIAGPVTFEDVPGIVQIAGNSAVQGKVMNGTIEFVDVDCGNT